MDEDEMLQEAHIRNFRSCRNVRLTDVGPLLVLVGRNGAGKTNILKAIRWAAQAATLTESVPFDYSEEPVSVELCFSAEEHKLKYRLETRLVLLRAADGPPRGRLLLKEVLAKEQGGIWIDIVSRDGEAVVLAGRREPLRIGETSPSLPAMATLLPTDDELGAEIRTALQFLSTIRYYPLDEPSDADIENNSFISQAGYRSWLGRLESGGDVDESVPLRLLHMWLTRKADYTLVKQLVGRNGLDLVRDIDIFNIDTGASGSGDPAADNYHFIRFRPSRGVESTRLTYNMLSLGTRRVLRILVSMIFDRSAVMLIEQPEDSLHPGLTKKLVATLRENAEPSQLILSSHSSALLNTLEPTDVRLVTMQNGETQIRSLSDLEVDAACNFMNREGSLSEFLESVDEEG